MNCREAQPQIFAERDGTLNDVQRAELNGHLAQCDSCRRVRDDLSAALVTWRIEATQVSVPDAEREWHAVRRQIRGGVQAGATGNVRSRRNLFTWIAVPLGAAAALAVALFVSPQVTSTRPVDASPRVQAARANSVDAPGNNASTMVFVDDKSGWLIVWASDAQPKQG